MSDDHTPLRSAVHLAEAIQRLLENSPACHRVERSGRVHQRLVVIRDPDGVRFEITVRAAPLLHRAPAP